MPFFSRLAPLIARLNRLRLWITRPLTVGVRLILLRAEQVLLVRHTYHPGWLLPGGGVEKGETLEAAARREAGEELGAQLGDLRLLGVYTNFKEYKSDHVIVFVCEDFQLPESPIHCQEIAATAFFPLDALPDDLFPGHRRRLVEVMQGKTSGNYGVW